MAKKKIIVDNTDHIIGRVFRSTGSWYEVVLDNGDIMPCRTVGKLRLKNLKVTNPIAVGDYVKIKEDEHEKTGSIIGICDRKNYVIRQSPRKKHFLHIIASNIDQAVVIATVREPMLKQGFIDRFLLMTEPFDIPVHIVFNKSDVYMEEDLSTYEYLKEIYEEIGYVVHLVSATEQVGTDALLKIFSEKTTLVGGQSGVGKSSLINAMIPDMDLRTMEISDHSGKGQHTTTFAEMYTIAKDTHIIDTPGIKTLSFNYLEITDVAHNFREFFKVSDACKFSNCMHRNEPKCAVKEGIENGTISELRYFNYVQILEEIEDQNYWELHT